MGDVCELLVESSVQNGVTMAVEVDPNRGGAVQVLSALNIDEVGSYPSLDNERFLLFPFLHLCKRMPEELPVPIAERRRLFSAAHVVKGRLKPLEDLVR